MMMIDDDNNDKNNCQGRLLTNSIIIDITARSGLIMKCEMN